MRQAQSVGQVPPVGHLWRETTFELETTFEKEELTWC
jgi:hypothetical protein